MQFAFRGSTLKLHQYPHSRGPERSRCERFDFFTASQLPVEILVHRIGVGSPEKLAAAHLNDDRGPHTHKTAEFRPIADYLADGIVKQFAHKK